MRYFFITQDTGLPDGIQFRDFDIKGKSMIFTKADSERLNDSTALYLSGTGKEARPDLIQRPVPMFSRRLKEIVDAYESGLIFKDVVLIHKENNLQYDYVQILMDELEVLSERCEWYPNRTLKKLVLDTGKIGSHHIFFLKGSFRKDPVISLPLAESLMRRRVTGICFEEVEVD